MSVVGDDAALSPAGKVKMFGWRKVPNLAAALFLLLAVSLAHVWDVWAQPSPPVRKVHEIDASDYFVLGDRPDFPSDTGLAFPPWPKTLLRLDEPTTGVATLRFVAPGTMPDDPSTVPLVISDPLNLTFDSKMDADRAEGAFGLFIFEGTTNELLAINAGPSGHLDPTTLTRFDAQAYGVQNPLGLAFNAATGHLFLLDGVGPTLIRV